jgi:biopolymer transport protein ExbD
VNEGQLITLLAETTRMSTEPELQFEPEALASYEISARVLQDIKSSGVTKFGFVGNEKYRTFGK